MSEPRTVDIDVQHGTTIRTHRVSVELKAHIEREAVAQERARLRAAARELPDDPDPGFAASPDFYLGYDEGIEAVLRLLDPEAEGGTP